MIKNSWVLALCGLLQALLGLMHFLMIDHGSLISRLYRPNALVTDMWIVAIAAGVCAIAAGIWRSKEVRVWLLVLNGLALIAYGLIPALWRGPLMLRPYFILLLVTMAMSIGILALITTLNLQDHLPDRWFLGIAGVACVGFALVFLACDFRWIALEPNGLWLLNGSCFALTAICLWRMAFRSNSLRVSNTLSTV